MESKVPQLLITLAPDGTLQVETAVNGVRRQQGLTQANAGQRLLRMLMEQKKRIDNTVAAERKAARRAQPDWELIARHPQVEIRRALVPVERYDVKGRNKAEREHHKSAEELGL